MKRASSLPSMARGTERSLAAFSRYFTLLTLPEAVAMRRKPRERT